MNIITPLLTDVYKTGHIFQYPKDVAYVYSNFTPRKSHIPGYDRMVFFGLQYFIRKYLIEHTQRCFFDVKLDRVLSDYKKVMKHVVGGIQSYDHIAAWHELGYTPLRIMALPEGVAVPMRVPCFTMVNTDANFPWMTNFWETQMSASIWQACTSATHAWMFRQQLDRDARLTGMSPEFVPFQGHDFSYRGMSSLESAILSGMGHLLSFVGTDTLPAVMAAHEYYDADPLEGTIGCSVPATEHSVMCAGGTGNEYETIKRLITDVYPDGIVSIVSDTWDLWHVLQNILPALKDTIMTRNGKVVIRPDSGDPADILCGTLMSATDDSKYTAQEKGVIQLLWDKFGGTTNKEGYRILDPHVGAIYGDSINLARAKEINERLAKKGFASQVVFGIGSYTYQYNTRDTFGTAIKSTWIQRRDGTTSDIYKSPVTDDGTKNSAKGLLSVTGVYRDGHMSYDVVEGTKDAPGNMLRPVFVNGRTPNSQTFEEVRARLREQ